MSELTFESLLAKMQALHDTKDRDYAGGERYANFRGSVELGIPPHIGAALRMRDKFSRAMNLLRNEWAAADARGPAVASETVDDTLLDLANYALIVLCLRAEWDDVRFSARFSPAAVAASLRRLAAEPQTLEETVIAEMPYGVLCDIPGCTALATPGAIRCAAHDHGGGLANPNAEAGVVVSSKQDLDERLKAGWGLPRRLELDVCNVDGCDTRREFGYAQCAEHRISVVR